MYKSFRCLLWQSMCGRDYIPVSYLLVQDLESATTTALTLCAVCCQIANECEQCCSATRQSCLAHSGTQVCVHVSAGATTALVWAVFQPTWSCEASSLLKWLREKWKGRILCNKCYSFCWCVVAILLPTIWELLQQQRLTWNVINWCWNVLHNYDLIFHILIYINIIDICTLIYWFTDRTSNCWVTTN